MKNILVVLFLIMAGNVCLLGQIQKVNMEATSKWQQDLDGITRINVYWENPSASNYQERIWVQEAIESTWEKHAKIDFVGWSKYDHKGKGIRILINDYSHPNCKGLGTKISGVYGGMELSFQFKGAFKCGSHSNKHCIKAIAVHEFGHALGIAHEQDRGDCGCRSHPGNTMYGGGHYVTPCDRNSVMNYCNPVWNNGGKLSAYDIQGIQAVYGVRDFNLDNRGGETVKGRLSISNELGADQIWENLHLTIGGSTLIFNLNNSNAKEIKSVLVSQSGYCNYTISSKTKRNNHIIYNGYGGGQIYIDKNKNYDVSLYLEEYGNKDFKIFLKAEEVLIVGDAPRNPISNAGNLRIYNELAPDQTWENLNLVLGDKSYIFNLNASKKQDTKFSMISQTGYYDYIISSKTRRNNNVTYTGYGRGQIHLKKSTDYNISVFYKNYGTGKFEIFLRAEELSNANGNNMHSSNSINRNNRFLVDGKKPVNLLKINNTTDKFYVYSNGDIYAYVQSSNKFFKCGTMESPVYKDWNGKKWAWTFKRPIGNNKTETYSISTLGEVWAMGGDGLFRRYGRLESIDF